MLQLFSAGLHCSEDDSCTKKEKAVDGAVVGGEAMMVDDMDR